MGMVYLLTLPLADILLVWYLVKIFYLITARQYCYLSMSVCSQEMGGGGGGGGGGVFLEMLH